MNNPLKILYLAHLSPSKFGSIEEHALFLSRELKRRGHQCYLSFISDPHPEIRQLFVEAGAKIVTIYCGNTHLVENRSDSIYSEMLALRRIVIKNSIDLVHINFFGITNPILFGLYLTRVKIVFTDHDSYSATQRSLFKSFLKWCVHGMISKRIYKYIAVSEFVRNRLEETHSVSDKKRVTIYNGVNLDRFVPQDINTVRKEIGLPLDIPIVCSVAMLIPEKGIQHLIEAVSFLVKNKNMRDLLALVVGEGCYVSQLEKLSKALGVTNNVRFLGRRSDVQTIIAASDVVVVPSVWQEAFGLIVAEAMACERPLVASYSGGIPELVEDGITGVLVPIGDSQRIAAALKVLLSDPLYRRNLGRNGREKVCRKFNLPLQVNQLVEIYQQAVGDQS